MRVVFCSYQFSDATNGGASTLVWELANGMAARGHEVLVVTCFDGINRVETIGNVRVVRFKMPLSFHGWGQNLPALSGTFSCWEHALEFYRAANQVIESFKPDIVEVPECYALGLMWAFERKFPLVVRLVCPAYLLFESGYLGQILPDDIRFVKSLELFVIGAADGRISICHELAERISTITDISPMDFDIIRVPLRLGAMPELKEAETKDFSPELFYFGRVEAQKGTETLIECLPLVAKVFPNFRLTMAGSHSPDLRNPGTHVEQLNKRLEELRLKNNVSFPGHIPIEEIKHRARNSDICVFPSTYETACYAAIEAMSYGGCVLATDVGGLPEYVKHGVSGWLVPPQDPAKMAEAIIKLASDKNLRSLLRKAAPGHAKVTCDPDVVVQSSIESYKKAIEKFHQPSVPNLAFSTVVKLIREAFSSQGMIVQNKDYASSYSVGFQNGMLESAAIAVDQVYSRISNPFRDSRTKK